MEGSVLVWVQTMTSQLATHYPTNGMNEILTVEVFKTILVRIMHVGMPVELMGGRVFNPILIMSILEKALGHIEQWGQGTYSVFLLVKHKRGNGLTLIGVGPGLSINVDGSTANAKVVSGTRDSMERGRHC